MIRKKSSFLTFCFSFLPGAGQMYMGFMKRGVSLMAGFFLTICLAVWLEIGLLVFSTLILWFYAFFDTFNLRSIPDDEFYTLEDNYLIFSGFGKDNTKFLQGKFRTILAVVLILMGFTILWNNVIDLFDNVLPEEIMNVIYGFGHYFPQLLVGFAIIAIGFYLIMGKKKELDTMDSLNQLDDKGGYER